MAFTEKLVLLGKDLINIHPNDPLPNLVEITEGEFIHALITNGFQYTEHRQCTEINPHLTTLRSFWVNEKEGIAVTEVVENARVVRGRYFSFTTCVHDFIPVTPASLEQYPTLKGRVTFGRCLHSKYCTKCHVIETVDSSD